MQTRPLPENWLRTDIATTAALLLVGSLAVALSNLAGTTIFTTPMWLQILGGGIMTVPLVWRRRFPLTSGLMVNGLYIAFGQSIGLDLYSSQVSLFLSFFSIGAWSGRRRAASWARALICVAMAVWLVASHLRTMEEISASATPLGSSVNAARIGLSWLINIAFFAAAWFFGEQGWKRAMDQAQLDEAKDSIHALQAELVSKAIEEERLRIARELHDVVAHHVTTMSVQAAAARRLLGSDPERARTALKEVESGARQAVKDLRTMVFTLRSSDGERESLPTLEDLAVLVTSSRLAGRNVTYEVIGERPRVSPSVELTLYRVAQEALTNAAKHAGPNASVAVRLRGRGETLELEIADDGVGMRSRIPGTGTGLIGMRERVTAVGGTLETGTKPRGGFRVRAEIPTGGNA